MLELEILVDYAYERGIELLKTNKPSSHKGCCIITEVGSAVILNESMIEESADELCIFAEEVGHIETGAFLPVSDYLSPYYKRLLKRKYEAKAEIWAINHVLPSKKIQSALDDCCTNDYDIAEYCNVTVDFLRKSVEYYRNQGVEFISEC